MTMQELAGGVGKALSYFVTSKKTVVALATLAASAHAPALGVDSKLVMALGLASVLGIGLKDFGANAKGPA